MVHVFAFAEMFVTMSIAWFVVEYTKARSRWNDFMATVKLAVENAEQEAQLRYARTLVAELPAPIDIPEGADICVCPGCDEHFVTRMPGTKRVGAFEFCSEDCWERPMPFPALPMDRRYPC